MSTGASDEGMRLRVELYVYFVSRLLLFAHDGRGSEEQNEHALSISTTLRHVNECVTHLLSFHFLTLLGKYFVS